MELGLIAAAMGTWAAGSALALAQPASAAAAPVTSLISAPENGASGPAQSVGFQHASSDGTRVFFTTEGNLVPADTDGLVDVYERAGGHTTLVSVSGAGASGSADIFFEGASSDGTRVFFLTTENLIGADTDGLYDVYERSGGQTTLLSVPGEGASGSARTMFFEGASSDGTRVFFMTDERLVSGDTDGAPDVYERSGGQTTLLSAAGEGASGSAKDARFVSTSSDGARVFFDTTENLVGADTDGLRDVYERSGGRTTLVSAPGFLRNGSAQEAIFAGASNDGTRVFFETTENLVGGDADGLHDIYERFGGQTTIVSAPGAGASGSPQVIAFKGASADGTRIVFETTENLVGGDIDGQLDVYERSAGQTTLLSAPGVGASGSAESALFAGASSDGTRVFFHTTGNLAGADTDALIDVYERSGSQTTLVSAPGVGASGSPDRSIFAGASSDGTRVFFDTTENLVGADTDGLLDIYERFSGETTLVSVPGVGASGSAQDIHFRGASSDGTRVFFQTAENLVGADSDGLSDLYESRLTNTPPAIEAVGDRAVGTGEQLQLTVSATDPEGDGLSYSASNLPPGASFDPASRTFTWTPSSDQAGSYTVRFQVSDGGASDAEDITITVSEAPTADSGGGSGTGDDSGTADTTAPETIKGKGPKRRIEKPIAKFSFSSNEPGSSFECKIDKREAKPCSSPIVARRLKTGKHTFSVTAIDAAGNRDLTPAIWKFRVAR